MYWLLRMFGINPGNTEEIDGGYAPDDAFD